MHRRIKCLPITMFLCERMGFQWINVIGPAGAGINISNLLHLVTALSKQDLIPPDVHVQWLWFDHRCGCWMALIWSEMFELIQDGETAPIVEFLI